MPCRRCSFSDTPTRRPSLFAKLAKTLRFQPDLRRNSAAALALTRDGVGNALLEPGQITVGTRVVIDHLGASKVGAELVIKAALVKREKSRFRFAVEIEDGARIVAKIEHERAAVSLEKIMKALG